MSDKDLKRPAHKAVREQQTILIWIGLLGIIGIVLLYSSYSLIKDTQEFPIGSVFLSGMAILILALVPLRYTKELKIARELDTNGVSTSGKITDKWVKKHRGENTSKSYFVSYEFGESCGAVQKVSFLVYRKLETGHIVTIRYLISDPNCSRIEVTLI